MNVTQSLSGGGARIVWEEEVRTVVSIPDMVTT